MIHHISIPAQHPLEVARTLAEVLSGSVTPFGPRENSFIAWARDEFGTAIEVFPAGTELRPDADDGQALFKDNGRGAEFIATHAAVSVPRTKAEIFEIAMREGWRAIELSRGAFRVIEFWVENTVMLELMTAEMSAEYLAVTKKFQRKRPGVVPETKEGSGG